jgi:Zn-dependent protease
MRELKELAVSILVLTVAFTIFFHDGIFGLTTTFSALSFGYYFFISFLAVLTAFFFHEMAHKFLAQKYGCWAEFNYSPMGLIFAMATSLVGIIFAAPGAVIIGGQITRDQYGKISAAGPGVNIAVGAAFSAVYFVARPFLIPIFPSGPGLAEIFYLLAWINVILGGFNLIPFPPLDGSKIVRWDMKVYVLMVIAAIGLFVALLLL